MEKFDIASIGLHEVLMKAPYWENKKIPIYQLFRELSSSDRGLTTEEAKRRQKQYGLNAIEEKKESLIVKALSYFWGPIAWMIEAAAILSFIIHHYADFVIIMFLLIFNAALAFWQEYQAGNAIEALKKKLALRKTPFFAMERGRR